MFKKKKGAFFKDDPEAEKESRFHDGVGERAE